MVILSLLKCFEGSYVFIYTHICPAMQIVSDVTTIRRQKENKLYIGRKSHRLFSNIDASMNVSLTR